LLSYAIYYYAPAMLGMKTGFPLYVVGSSTFGTAGGYVMPGLLMGLLQIGWFAVGTYFSTLFIMNVAGSKAGPGSLPFIVVGIIWGYTMAYIGVMGIQYVAKLSRYLIIIPIAMILLVFFRTSGGIAQYTPADPKPFVAFTVLIQLIIGFFATAGAAGADFGMNSRNAKDVRMGGLVGITLAIVFAAGLPLLSVAGASKLYTLPGLGYDDVIGAIGGGLATSMFLLFVIASIAPACFCAFIAGNSFSTMIPGVPRISSTMAGVTVAIVLAVTGAAADYLLSGKRWAGPREGINWAGYGAWALGFLVGILPFLPVSASLKTYVQPAVVYSFVTGFVVYAVLAKAGLEPKTVPIPLAVRSAAR
jgi:cytosine permease